MAKYTNIGSVSSGTLRTQDLLPCFLDTLSELDKARAEELQREAYRSLYGNWVSESDMDDDMSALLDDVMDALNENAPPYFYFGAHPGDGADFGFWLDGDSMDATFDGARVSDLSELPECFQGEVVVVNDHGNTSLLVADGKGNMDEIWAIV